MTTLARSPSPWCSQSQRSSPGYRNTSSCSARLSGQVQSSSRAEQVSNNRSTSQAQRPSMEGASVAGPKDASRLALKFQAAQPSQIVDSISTTAVPRDSSMAARGTAISLRPNGTGGCSTSSGVSDIQDLVTIACRCRLSSTLAHSEIVWIRLPRSATGSQCPF